MKRVKLKPKTRTIAQQAETTYATQVDDIPPEVVNPRLMREHTPLVSKAIVCKFCGHPYLEPCDDAKQKTCPNVKVKGKKRK